MAKITKSVRMSEKTLNQLDELGILLKEGMPDLIERAVGYLYSNRQSVYEEDIEERRNRINNSKKSK